MRLRASTANTFSRLFINQTFIAGVTFVALANRLSFGTALLHTESCNNRGYKSVMTEAVCGSGEKQMGLSDFPFLQDVETVKYIQESKVLFIIRGLPGSGKSYLANEISKTFGNSVVCCADNFRPPDLKYPFSKDILSTSHRRCQKVLEDAAKDGTSVLVTDNSNLRIWEMQPYLMLANEYNYTQVVVEPKTIWKYNPAELAAKSTQGVPQAVIQKKLKSLDHIYPYFYGWFVNHTDSLSMRGVAERVYAELLEQPQFVEEFKSHVVPDAPRNKDGSVQLNRYFSSKDFDVGPDMLHCTAFYSDQGQRDGSVQYHNRPAVQHSLGKAYKLKIIGFLVTPRSFGARLKLDDKELLLWNNSDESAKMHSPTESQKNVHKGMGQLTVDPNGKGQCAGWHPTEFSPTSGSGSSAHLSVGTSPGFNAVQTGLDLMQLVQDELSAKDDTSVLTVLIKSGKARCYGNGNWLVYLEKPSILQALYSGYY